MPTYLDFSDLEETLIDLIQQIKDPPWSITITKTDNGYTLCGNDINFVIEDSNSDELKSGEELLQMVMEHFVLGGSKHDPCRLRIIREEQ